MPRCPRLLLDKLGRICVVNEAAAAIIRDSGHFRVRQGSLGLRNPTLHRHFCEALERSARPADAAPASQNRVHVSAAGKTPGLVLVVSYFSAGHSAASAYVMVSLYKPDVPPLQIRAGDIAVIQSLYELTAAECNIASAMLEGRTVAQTAQALCITPQTVRQHLKSIMRKTGTHRQAELIALLLRNGCVG
ncbi:helix-turn-helix transcriptional regulator [Granulosicoccaceae sp. 1_MG-2023]|nr:helix-turn-helix transcriptional regulator [Granulosicoccaceae sp. 1_MG-2023]